VKEVLGYIPIEATGDRLRVVNLFSSFRWHPGVGQLCRLVIGRGTLSLLWNIRTSWLWKS